MSTASNLLWAHLLRKDVTTTTANTDTPCQIPPIAPQDRTATSMRMLIHDTQVNLEKFSTRLDGLLQRVDDCRTQVVNANKLLDVERDKVLTEILEIANRCQSEMKAHVGTPAQAPALDLVRVSQVSTERSMQALEKRIDALQVLLQTHAHAMQSIQDQQNNLIGIQIDRIKTSLSDMVASAVVKSVESIRSTLVSEFAHRHAGCARSSSVAGSVARSTSSSRCRRSNGSVLGPREINVCASSPLDSRRHGGPHLSLKRTHVEGAQTHTGDSRKLPRLGLTRTNPSLLGTPRTPRQPLADLPLAPGNNTPRVQRHVASHMGGGPYGYGYPSEALLGTDAPVDQAPPLQPRPGLEDVTTTPRCSVGAASSSTMGIRSAAGPLDPDALSKEIKTEKILKPNLTGVLSVHSSPLSSPSLPLSPATRHDPSETDTNMTLTQQHIQLRHTMPDALQIELIRAVPPPSSNPDVSPPKSMSLRDRRAQISRFGRAETRRFIPLVPWSDEEE